MASSLTVRARAALVVTATVALSAVASPAFAMSKHYDGQESSEPMAVTTAVLIFLGIPALVAAIVWLLVFAPGWTRSGRADAADAWAGEPLEVGAASGGAGAITASGATPSDTAPEPDDTGGTSATW